jgi:hypothetical protein
MSYTIKKSDGTTLAVVPENDIVNDKASVALIGRGSTNYGIKHSEAFVHLLENFAHTTPPAHPLLGQLWFDKTLGALKVYKDNAWSLVGSGGTGSGGGPVSVTIGNTNVIAMVAGGKIVMVISSKDIPNGDIPVSISVLNQTVPFRAEFPFGIEAGTTLSPVGAYDYIYKGRVPEAEQAMWAGGGNPFAATSFLDLGPNSITLTISNNAMVAAFSQVAVPANNLPTNFNINGLVVPLRAAFPNGLAKGLTLAVGMGISSDNINGGTSGGGSGGSVTTQVVADMISEETTARASAITELYAYANGNFATAGSVTNLSAAFTSGTGQATLAEAIDYLIVSATEGTANAEAGTTLRAEFTNAITGATSFANALQILNASVAADYATASDLTQLESRLEKDGIPFAISKAMQKLLTQAVGEPKVSVRAASTGTLVLSGAQTIDGISCVAGDRILVKNQTSPATNGIYVVASGSWARASDADTYLELVGAFVLVNEGSTLSGTAWVCTSSVSGTLGSTPITWERRDMNTVLAQFKTELNAEFVGQTGYNTVADAIQDLQVSSGGSGSTAAFDTDLRTRFTNALAPNTDITTAMGKLQAANGDLDAIIAALRALPGNSGSDSVATAAQRLVSTSSMNSAISQATTNLTAGFVSDMNDLTGGTGSSFASAMTDVIASATSDGSGSTSSIDTSLRNLFVTKTHESSHPITSIGDAITKLMTNTTADRAAALRSEQLETIFTSGLGVSLGQASTALSSVSTKANAAASFEVAINSALSGAGYSSASQAFSAINTISNANSTNSSAITNLESAFKAGATGSGTSNVSTAIQQLWTAANASGSQAGWGVTVNAQGVVAGIELLANSATNYSAFTVAANRFAINQEAGGTPVTPFRVEGGVIYMDNIMIANGSLGYEKLVQTTFTSESYTTNALAVPDSPTAVLSVTTPALPTGSKVVLFFNCNCTGSDSGGVYVSMRRNDGLYCQGRGDFGNPDEGGSAQAWTFTDTIPTVSSPTVYSYTAMATRFGGSSTIRSAHLIGLTTRQVGSIAGSGAGGSTEPPASGGGYYDPGTGGTTGGTGGGGFSYDNNTHIQ